MKDQLNTVRNSTTPVTLNTSAEELRRNFDSIRVLIDANTLTPEQKNDAEEWLKIIEQRVNNLDETTKSAIVSLRTRINESRMTPQELAKKIAEGVKDPQNFDQFIEAFLQKRPTLSPEQAIIEFHTLWQTMIAQQGYTVKIENNALVIYTNAGVRDDARTASLKKIPDAVQIYNRQMTFLRAQNDTTSRSAKERVMNMVTEYNRQVRAKNSQTKPLDPLTEAVLQNTEAKNVYINNVVSS